jgi:Nif-specific regulatory protein
MAATNRDLEKLVEQGQFRLDLFYRLHVFPIIVPPLRERKEDIPSLLNHFVLKVSREYGRDISFTPAALEVLRQHDWPGNVREMENMIERLVIMSDSNRIESDFLYNYLTPSQPASSTSPSVTHQKTSTSLKDVEYNELVSALQRSDWVQYKAAKELGLTPRQMGYRVKKFGLQKMIAKGRAGLL